uniref:Putative secreted protein n=1 Tax=Ixodes ricinus TaxID=34613 RepID=A0A6B0UJL4_IXORI
MATSLSLCEHSSWVKCSLLSTLAASMAFLMFTATRSRPLRSSVKPVLQSAASPVICSASADECASSLSVDLLSPSRTLSQHWLRLVCRNIRSSDVLSMACFRSSLAFSMWS